jgi:hypothetical protein
MGEMGLSLSPSEQDFAVLFKTLACLAGLDE